MITQTQFLERLVSIFEQLKIVYVVVGSVASSVHGEPRSTNDLDIVIRVSAPQLSQLVATLAETCYVSIDAANQAFKNRSMFNVMDLEYSWKADLIVHDATPFEIAKLRRRVEVQFQGVPFFCLSPEDSILSKLHWAELGSSEFQMRDALNVARIQWDDLDFRYLEIWAGTLGVKGRLQEILEQAPRQLPPKDSPPP